jgi:hypothetical protein
MPWAWLFLRPLSSPQESIDRGQTLLVTEKADCRPSIYLAIGYSDARTLGCAVISGRIALKPGNGALLKGL